MAIIKDRRLDPLQRLAHTLEQARRPFDQDMLLNLAFFHGQQYAEWKDDISSIRNRPRDVREKSTPRPVVNKVAHFVQQSHATALATKPTVDVLPGTGDLHDGVMSKIGLAYLQWLTEPQQEHWDLKLSEAVMWAVICGPAYHKWTFSQAKKRPCIQAISPLDVYVDPYVSNFADARYVLHRPFMDPEQVYDIWGVEVKEKDMASVDPVKAELTRAMGYSPVQTGVQVHELWHVPSRRYPKGLFAVWAGNQFLVEPGAHPYNHKRLPFTQIGVIPRPGTPYHNSAVTYGRSPQMELNKYHAQRIQIRQNFAAPKWFVDSALELDNEPDDSPNQVIHGDSQGGRLIPQILQPAAMADNNEGVWITEEMQHVWGLHEIMQGQAPGRVESARALELLKDPDIARLAELHRTIDNSISEGFWQSLLLAQQYVKEDVLVQIYSRDGSPEVHKFKTENFGQGYRVRVTRANGLPRNRAERQEYLIRLWDSQVIQDPMLMAELLELPFPSFSLREDRDIKLARSENYTLGSGIPILPNSWDNHLVHIREHNEYRKTSEYAQLSDNDKTIIEFHVQQHEQAMIANAQKQLMQQAEVAGVMAPSAQEPVMQDPEAGEEAPKAGPGQAPGGPPPRKPAGA